MTHAEPVTPNTRVGDAYYMEGYKTTTAPMFRKLIKGPTQEDIDVHNIDHGDFRSWCPPPLRKRENHYVPAHRDTLECQRHPQLEYWLCLNES